MRVAKLVGPWLALLLAGAVLPVRGGEATATAPSAAEVTAPRSKSTDWSSGIR